MRGGYTKGTELGYDNIKGYITSDIIDFISSKQPKAWRKINDIHGDNAKEYFLQRMEGTIKEQGLLYTLRHEIQLDGQKIKLIYFKPENNINEDLEALYAQNICIWSSRDESYRCVDFLLHM
jgi:type I restriction enzyme R subunit